MFARRTKQEKQSEFWVVASRFYELVERTLCDRCSIGSRMRPRGVAKKKADRRDAVRLKIKPLLQGRLSRLLHVRRRLSIRQVKRHFADLDQVEVAPLDRGALFILDAKIPFPGLLFRIELDLRTGAIRQRLLSENVLAPILFISRRDVEGMDLNTGRVDDREILIASEAGVGVREYDDRAKT